MAKTSKPKAPHAVLGWCEWVKFPEFGNVRIKAKTDTGAQTSALHAWKIKPFEKEGENWISFEIHPLQKSQKDKIRCEAKVTEIKVVKSSNGQKENRYTITTHVIIGPYEYPIDLTLTNRDEMGYRMLIGRAAIAGCFLVDCGHSYIQTG
ncbi:MAG: ATP-dependent zinc protease [Methylocystaceae bacterium]|nr:ATP-dependent zinc protease [Methylocystaceae bacterium]